MSRRAELPSPWLHGGIQQDILVSTGVLQLPTGAQHPVQLWVLLNATEFLAFKAPSAYQKEKGGSKRSHSQRRTIPVTEPRAPPLLFY